MIVLDSDIIIYSALPQNVGLRRYISSENPGVSVISRVEVLGFYNLSEEEVRYFDDFFNAAKEFPLSDDIVQKAIEIRQERKMGLGNSLIASTAIVHGLSLLTNNSKDFKWIKSLALLDPFED